MSLEGQEVNCLQPLPSLDEVNKKNRVQHGLLQGGMSGDPVLLAVGLFLLKICQVQLLTWTVWLSDCVLQLGDWANEKGVCTEWVGQIKVCLSGCEMGWVQ